MAVSLHERCMNAVVAAIEALPLSGGLAARFYKTKLPTPMQSDGYPCGFATIQNCTPKLVPFTTEDDERTLPVAVVLMDRQDPKDATTLSPWLLWLEQLPSTFLAQRLSAAVPNNWRIEIRMMATLDIQKAAGPGYENAVSGFWVDCICNTPRGTNNR